MRSLALTPNARVTAELAPHFHRRFQSRSSKAGHSWDKEFSPVNADEAFVQIFHGKMQSPLIQSINGSHGSLARLTFRNTSSCPEHVDKPYEELIINKTRQLLYYISSAAGSACETENSLGPQGASFSHSCQHFVRTALPASHLRLAV